MFSPQDKISPNNVKMKMVSPDFSSILCDFREEWTAQTFTKPVSTVFWKYSRRLTIRVHQQSDNYPIPGEAVWTGSHSGPAAELASASELPSTGLELSPAEPIPGSSPSLTSPFKPHLLRQRSLTALSQQPLGPIVLLHSSDFISFTALIPNQYICLLLTVCLVH